MAALAAAGAVWVLAGGAIPRMNVRIPAISARVLGGAVIAAILGGATAYGLLGTTAPAVAIGLLATGVPVRIASSRVERRLAERTDRWPDLIAHMRSSVAAGATVPDAFVDACDRVGGSFPETADVVRREVAFGGGFGHALDLIRTELADPTADRVLATLAVAQRTGGHRVGDVLSTLGASVADELRLRKAHDAAMTEQRWTASVALVAPWVLLSLSIATNPQAAGAFDTTEGMMIVLGGLLATGLGWVFAMRASRLSATPRLFR